MEKNKEMPAAGEGGLREASEAMVTAALEQAGSAWGMHLGGPIKRKLMREAIDADNYETDHNRKY